MKCSTEMPRYLQYSDAITTGGPSVTKSNTGSVPEEPLYLVTCSTVMF